MIPKAYITEWSNFVLWKANEQVEQDLVIGRALIEIYSDEFLSKSLAFRGGTALHKLFLTPQMRYSEDIDLVQINAGPFGELADRLASRLSFLGDPRRLRKENNFTLLFRFESEYPPVQTLKLKVETNCREHFTVTGFNEVPFAINSRWYSGGTNIVTYHLEELTATKLRALYQRSKGRDLYDLYKVLTMHPNLDYIKTLEIYYHYMKFTVEPPSKKRFTDNLTVKMQDSDFLGDTTAILSPNEKYDPVQAFLLVKKHLLENL